MSTDQTPAPITFLVSGDPIAIDAARDAAAPGKVRAVRIAGSTRGATMQRLEAQPGQDIVVLTVGSAGSAGADLHLRLHPEHARDLMRAQAGAPTRATATTADADGAVQVPASARWQGMVAAGSSRGLPGDVAFTMLELVGLASKDALAKLAATELGEKLDGQVTEGLYRLDQHHLGSLKLKERINKLPSAEPTLVLIHGTFFDTQSSFGALWGAHSDLVAQLFAHYGGRVYALDHATVMRSPIANALTLAETLPDGACLHLLTHSRGGLVAEVLLRASMGVSAADLDLFSDDAHVRHLQDLRRIGKLLRSKKIKVERIVRVACPAYGTLLASNRLDAYLSVLAWLLERAGLPVAAALLDFTDAVARQRTDPAQLPGLEAMRSNSNVLRWLNGASKDVKPAAGALRVVAGNIIGDSLLSWVKALLADSFFWTDNDLVVQTRSMYGGMPRQHEASFMLDRSGKIDHFSYFKKDSTAAGIARALMQDRPDGFTTIGPLSRRGQDASGTRAAQPAAPLAEDDGTRPALIVLPDFMGSNLQRDGQRAWFVWSRLHRMFERLEWQEKDGVTDDGPVDSHYGELIAYLRTSHDVVRCGYDWRAPLKDSARLLAASVEKALQFRATSRQPVRVLAHGMGCIVLRLMQLECPQVWQKMMQCDGARVLMLAPPNGGCWVPMTILSGDDQLTRQLASIGGEAHALAVRRQMARFPGLLQLQAGLNDPALSLNDAASWQDMAQRDLAAARLAHPWHNCKEQAEAWRWASPSQVDLDAAVQLRVRLDAQLPSLLDDAARMAIVLGQAPATPCGVGWDDSGMHYLGSVEGDGRVTWASSRLPGVATWKTGHPHGDLPKAKANFAAYAELLESGHTARLKQDNVGTTAPPLSPLPRLRDDASITDGTPLLDHALLDAALGSTVTAPRNGMIRSAKLTVEVVHGDLKFVCEPLLLGHLRGLKLTGSEQVVDELMDHALQNALDVGLYPVELGQHQIFTNGHSDPDNPYAFPRPKAALIVGLGDEGELTPNALTDAVRQAMLAYQRQDAAAAASDGGSAGATEFKFASTTLGSGGNLSVSQSVLALVRGVCDANARLASSSRVQWPQVTHLHIIELFQDRALEAWHALHLAAETDALEIELKARVRAADGHRSRPLEGNYRAAGYDLVRIGEASAAPDRSHDELEFSLFTKRARSEVRGKSTQRALVAAMVAAAEMKTGFDVNLARSLFQLLVPQEIKSYLGAAGTLLFEVDSKTAAYPWEMLDDSKTAAGREPFALRNGGTLLRKMRVDRFRRQPVDAPTDDVLVIGTPRLDPSSALPDLQGARDEARAVADLFGVEALLDQDFLEIVTTALTRPFKIIHMAGHGQYDKRGGRSGMLMSGGLRFGPAEFESMDTVPELVFVNCCHLGKTEGALQRDHALFAANVAEQLIREGVRCVVAAGWAVDDAAAQAFALEFYRQLQEGATFSEAVLEGRKKSHASKPDSNTWAAYQCYGDPGWTLRRNGKRGMLHAAGKTPLLAASDELLVALEEVQCDAQSAGAVRREQLRDKLWELNEAAPEAWKASGRIAQAFGMAWRDVGDKSRALQWLDRAVQAADGTASLAAREQQLNLRARQADTTGAIRSIIKDIDALITLAPTGERRAILGSAYKRVVMTIDAARDRNAGQAIEPEVAQPEKILARDLKKMMKAYAQAEEQKPNNLFYMVMQRCLAQLRLHWLGQATAPTKADLQTLRQSLAQRNANSPEFWCVVGQHEADMLEGVIKGDLATRIAGMQQGMVDVHGRVNNPHHWSSVHDTAQFLLRPYIAKSTGGENKAAQQYLDLIGSFTLSG